MKKAEMKVIRFDETDVIATSGCSSLESTWTSNSYKATANMTLNTGNNSYVFLYNSSVDENGNYYYMNGVGYNERWGNKFNEGSYYHYDSNSFARDSLGVPEYRSFWLCTNESHHNQ